jgi:hypothetical protein
MTAIMYYKLFLTVDVVRSFHTIAAPDMADMFPAAISQDAALWLLQHLMRRKD